MNIVLRNCSFKINPGKNKKTWEYMNSGDWEVHSFDIFDYFIPNNGVVLDIGAWSGVLSFYAANNASRVYALDPDPICFKELIINIKLNPIFKDKVLAYNIGISNAKEIVQLSARETYGNSSSSILERKRDKEHSKMVKTVTLLDFIQEENVNSIDFIKMDVEGAEFQILPTIKKALEKVGYPTLYISFHYDYLNEHIYYNSISSSFFNKVLLKLEKILKFSLFKNKIRKKIANLYNDLLEYEYVYNTDGNVISKDFLKKNPEYIKKYDLVFTNKKWKKTNER
jgi:FkbM family methyltransferase